MAEKKPKKNFKRSRKWWFAFFIFIIIVGAAYYWYAAIYQTNKGGSEPTAASFAAARVPVRTTSVTQGTLEEYIKAIGTVQAFNIVTVRSRVEGELLDIYFEDGQFVEAGDVLALVDPKPYELRVAQAKGQYK